jgi:hypothetical protein
MAIDIVIKDNHLQLDGINFFRGNANGVQLGSVGEKKTPATQENYLAVEENIPVKKLKVNKVTVLTLNGAHLSGADVDASLEVDGFGTLSAGAVATKLKEETLKLVKIDVLPRDIVSAANESPKALDALIQCGHRGRIAHQVITVMDARTAETVRRGVSFGLEPVDGGPGLTVKGGAGSTDVEVVRINSGATFGYLLLEPKWDAHQQKNWKKIEEWEDDQWSLY